MDKFSGINRPSLYKSINLTLGCFLKYICIVHSQINYHIIFPWKQTSKQGKM